MIQTPISYPFTPRLDEDDIQARRRAVINAIASQRLEGLEPDARVILQLNEYAIGAITIEEILADFRKRIANDYAL